MAYTTLKAAIDSALPTNGTNSITALAHRTILKQAVDDLAAYDFKGIAAPGDTPAAFDGKVYYMTAEAGTYTNFGGLTVSAGELVLLTNDGGGWVKNTLGFSVGVNSYQHNDCWIRATGSGVTTALVAGVLTVTIPSGVRLQYLRFNTNSTDLAAASDLTIRIDDQNGDVNQGTVDTFCPPIAQIIQRDNLSNDPPTLANPFEYTVDNAPSPQQQITNYGSDQIDITFKNIDSYDKFSVVLSW